MKRAAVAALLLAWIPCALIAQESAQQTGRVKQSLDVVSGTNSSASASQQKIEQLSGETRALLPPQT